MIETIQNILDTIDKKKVQSYCKRVIKKCSFKSVKDMKNLTGLVIWLYVYKYYDEIINICEVIKNVEFTGNYSFTPSLSKNCAAVIHFGCSISRLKKSLSPVKIISTSDTIAAFKIGWSFASRISFSAWSTAGINS